MAQAQVAAEARASLSTWLSLSGVKHNVEDLNDERVAAALAKVLALTLAEVLSLAGVLANSIEAFYLLQ